VQVEGDRWNLLQQSGQEVLFSPLGLARPYGVMFADGVPLLFDVHIDKGRYIAVLELLTECQEPVLSSRGVIDDLVRAARRAGLIAVPYASSSVRGRIHKFRQAPPARGVEVFSVGRTEQEALERLAKELGYLWRVAPAALKEAQEAIARGARRAANPEEGRLLTRLLEQARAGVKVAPVGAKGLGLVATRELDAGARLLEVEGDRVPEEKMRPELQGRYVQVAENEFIEPSGSLVDYLNHACVPNAGFRWRGGRPVLETLHPVPAGEEICIDYSTVIGNDFEMECACGATECRKVVRKFGDLPREIWRNYSSLGIVAPHLVDDDSPR
jgi:hypothetical protein